MNDLHIEFLKCNFTIESVHKSNDCNGALFIITECIYSCQILIIIAANIVLLPVVTSRDRLKTSIFHSSEHRKSSVALIWVFKSSMEYHGSDSLYHKEGDFVQKNTTTLVGV